MNDLTGNGLIAPANKMHYTLRVAAAMCFIGHGAFGIITKPIWCNYFAVFGIGHDLAYRLMPIVGTMDITMGLILLFYPIRAIPAWLVIWGLVTAALRPLSGEPFAELIERAGNFGAPLALLLLAGNSRTADNWQTGGHPISVGKPVSGIRAWFTRLSPHPQPDEKTFARVMLVLRIIVFLLLAGHGWLNLIQKKGLIQQYTSLGFEHPSRTAFIAGLFEMISAVALLIRPVRPLLIALFVWKIGTELFYPHWEIFEWVERGGSYGALLALYFALGKNAIQNSYRQTKLAV